MSIIQFFDIPDIASRFLKPSRERDVIYHYTSQPGLTGILQTGEFYSSDVLFLNDKQEMKEALCIALNILEHPKDHNLTHSSSQIQVICKALSQAKESLYSVSVFVFSFSGKDDDLSLWRGYGNPPPGYALGFNIAEFRKIIDQNIARPMLLAPCIYSKHQKEQLILQILEIILDRLPPSEAVGSFVNESEPPYFYLEVSLFLLFASFIKHESFKDEEEWRLSICLDPYEHRAIQLKGDESIQVKQGSESLRPFMNLQIDHDYHKLPLSEIIIGPSTYPVHTARALSDLLISTGYSPQFDRSNVARTIYGYEGNEEEPVQIRNSEIPFRNW